MKLPDFTYHRPDTVDGALALLDELGDDAKVLAGGQSCCRCWRWWMNAVPNLVDIARIPELKEIEVGPGGINIGAGVRTQAEFSPVVGEHAPLVAGRCPTSGIGRSATGAPSEAAWRTRTRRPNCPRRSRWTPG